MNISIEKNIFVHAVHMASRFAERRHATLPALSALLILAGDDGIKLRATNLETGIDLKLPGTCVSEGVVAVPASVLEQVASSLTHEGPVALERTGETLSLKSGAGRSTIRTVPYDDFPSIPLPEGTKRTFVLPGVQLAQLFTSIAACASTSSVRPELSSLLLSLENNALTAVATDSFRLVEKKVPLVGRGAQGSLLVPAKNALDVAQALPDEEVTVSFDEHQCAFSWESGLVVSRLTNAAFPDYRQIIPKESIVEAVVLRRDLETALKRTAVFSDAFQKIRISFNTKQKRISLFARNAEVGESSEEISARVSGTDIELSFNHRYLSAALGLTGAESLALSAAGIGRPLILKGVGDASLLYLVSPMNQ